MIVLAYFRGVFPEVKTGGRHTVAEFDRGSMRLTSIGAAVMRAIKRGSSVH